MEPKDIIKFDPNFETFEINTKTNLRDHQSLMDVVYYILNLPEYKGTKDRLELARKCGPKFLAAVQLGNFNYQVGNGGVSQWVNNYYAQEDLVDIMNLIDNYRKKLINHEIDLGGPSNLANDYDIKTCNNIYNLLDEIFKCADPTKSKWIVECEYCDGSGKEEEEDEDGNIDEIDCCHCGGSGESYTKDYERALEFFDYQSVEQKFVTPESKLNDFNKWLELFQRILDNINGEV